jgi:hypothetical protein
MQAGRPRSVGLACFSGSRAKLYLKRLFVCLSANCRRDARDPLVSPAFQDRGRNYISNAFLFAFRQNAGETPAIRWAAIRFKNDPQITQIRKIFFRDKKDNFFDTKKLKNIYWRKSKKFIYYAIVKFFEKYDKNKKKHMKNKWDNLEITFLQKNYCPNFS